MALSVCFALSALLKLCGAQTAVFGAGSTLAAPLYQDAAIVFKQQPLGKDSNVSFYGMGSSRGLCRIQNSCNFTTDTYTPRLIDFAGTDSILPAGDYTKYPDIQLYPAVAAAVVPVYNLPGLDGIVLNLDILSRIYYGAIGQWNHPAIVALNPSRTLPANKIEVVARSDGSGTTEIFKKALSNSSITFRNLVGASSNASWGNNTNNVTLKQGNQGIISYVAATRFTIGYAALGEAKDSFLQIASLSTPTGIVAATTSSIASAVQVLGASFGNNGDAASRLTADLVGVRFPAWPIVGYTYFALRKNTLRTNATCETVYQTVAFLNFFYTSPLISAVIATRQFAPLSSATISTILGRFSEIQCGGAQVWVTQPVVGAGSTLAAPLYQDAALTYAQYTSKASVSFFGMGSSRGICRIENNCSSADTWQPKLIDFAGSDSILSAADYRLAADLQMFPAVAAAVVPVYNLPGISNLVLSLDVLARIYFGAISRWNDWMIGALNPTIRASLPNSKIEVVARSDGSGTTEIFKKALSNSSVTFRRVVGASSNASWGNNTRNITLQQGNLGVISYVTATRFTISYAALGEAVDAFIQIARLSVAANTVLTATTSAIASAVQQLGGSFGNNGDLPATRLTADLVGARPPAWPIVGYTYFVLRKTTLRTNSTCAIVKQTVAFLRFFYTSPAVSAVIQQRQFAPLSSSVQATVLSRLSSDAKCNGQPVLARAQRRVN